MMRVRGPRDHDYLRTTDGLFFTVVGDVHPRDRALAYLKYVPSCQGKWGRGKKRFGRALKYYTIPHLIETLSLLERSYPQYLFYSDVYKITFSSVPLDRVAWHYLPEMKLARMSRAKRLDALQDRAVKLARLLSEESGAPHESLGVTGSILIDIHRPEFSDIDLTVYGKDDSLMVRRALLSLLGEDKGTVRRLQGGELRNWCESKSRLYPLTYEEAGLLYHRKWDRGTFVGTPFSVHAVRIESEVDERYGDRLYTPIGIIEADARVVDSSEAIFLPAIYLVNNVETAEGPSIGEIREVVSYEGLYKDLASEGEFIMFKGKLERVEDQRSGKTHYRVIVGSSEAQGEDYIKPILR